MSQVIGQHALFIQFCRLAPSHPVVVHVRVRVPSPQGSEQSDHEDQAPAGVVVVVVHG